MRYLALGDFGDPVLLIHGLGASADIWMHNIETISKTHRVYVPDLPGFGRSDQPDPFSPDAFTRFINDFTDALNIGKASIAGQSLGGGIAIQYSLQFPEKVDRLVLVDSAGLGKEVIWTLKAMSLPGIGELFSYPSRLYVELFFKLAVHDRALITADVIDLYYGYFSRPGFQKYLLKVVRSIVDIHGARDELINPIVNNLHKLDKPTLIIWGEKDRVLPLKHARFGQNNIPGSKLYIFKDCGHLPFFERSDEFNGLVLDFLSV